MRHSHYHFDNQEIHPQCNRITRKYSLTQSIDGGGTNDVQFLGDAIHENAHNTHDEDVNEHSNDHRTHAAATKKHQKIEIRENYECWDIRNPHSFVTSCNHQI
ncbi:hypothetical protein V9T40_005593 [Parthenolecanium corni]|uniref:Uncharacterized protein n=1 Tax=Parthenolecanium corni TaxID=536013 RepID=A0AAN9TVC9_9HEMI